jgi:hypothetical protein
MDRPARQSKTPDAAIAYAVTMLCTQFSSNDHTKDVMDNLQLLLDRASRDPAFEDMRSAARRLIAARREDLADGGRRFFAVRIEERAAVEAFAWRRFCELFDEARSVAPNHSRREA